MKINHETKVKLSIVTDFNEVSLEKEIIHETRLKVREIIDFINQLEKTEKVKTSIYENSFTASFGESIVCLSILDNFIDWDDIITYKNIYEYYERM